MITLFLFIHGGAVGLEAGLRRDGGLNSSGVAPTPMHPAATGQLKGNTNASGCPSTSGRCRGVHDAPPSWVTSKTGDPYPLPVASEAER